MRNPPALLKLYIVNGYFPVLIDNPAGHKGRFRKDNFAGYKTNYP